MGDRPAAERACKDPNPIIDGRKANVNLAILGAKPRVIPPSKYALKMCCRYGSVEIYLRLTSCSFVSYCGKDFKYLRQVVRYASEVF